MSNENIYVVLKCGFEYNDEIHYRVDENGGEPINVFWDKRLAELYEEEMNLKQLRSMKNNHDNRVLRWVRRPLAIGDFCYELKEVDINGKLESVLSEICENGNYFEPFKEDTTDEDLKRVLAESTLRWYETVQVPATIPNELIKKEIESRNDNKG